MKAPTIAVFVAVGSLAQAASLEEWTARASGTANNLNDVASNGRVFVVVGDKGIILVSPDGTQWTPQPSNTTVDLHAVAWGCGQFVTVGNTGFIATSRDGLRWTQRDAATNKNLWNVTANTTLLVATGDSSVIRASEDGAIWPSVYVLGARMSYRAGFWDGYEFIFVSARGGALSGNGTRLDFHGVTYVPPESAGTVPMSKRRATTVPVTGVNAVGGRPNRYEAVGDGGKLWNVRTLYNWRIRDSGTTENLRGINWSANHGLIVGANGTILVSKDGETWAKRPAPAGTDLFAAAHLGSSFVAVGANGTILTSTEWPLVAQPTITPGGNILTEPKRVTLLSATPGAVVRYTRDGSEPTAAAPAFDGPFWVDKAQTLRVRAFKEGMDDSLETRVDYLAVQGPAIVKEPEAQKRFTDEGAGFVTVATGVPDVSYQWQMMRPTGNAWENLRDGIPYSGTTRGALGVGPLKMEMDGLMFRCVVKNPAGEVISHAVSLTVVEPKAAEITKQSRGLRVHPGETAEFSVAAEGRPDPTYQWVRVSASPAHAPKFDEHGPYSGIHSPTLTIRSVTPLMAGDRFYCVVINHVHDHEERRVSTPATLVVMP